MAYAAVISLKQTINRLLKSHHTPSLSSNPEILPLMYKNLTSLQKVLERSDDSSSIISRKRLNALDALIKEAVHELEELLESQVSNHFLSESKSNIGDHFPMQEVVDSLMEAMKKIEEEYVKELEHSSPEDEEAVAVSSKTDFGVKMVGLSKEFNHIKSKLLKGVRPDDFGVFSFVGMAGSGRSMRANALFELIGGEQSVECKARVTVGSIYELKEILGSILRQVNGGNISEEGDEEVLGQRLYSSLSDRKFIIMIDDIWETQVWEKLKLSFPHGNNGSLVLITTSFRDVAVQANCSRIFQIPVLDEDRTWDVLRAAVCGPGPSPAPFTREFEECGKAVARNTEGRIFSIAKAVLHLLRANHGVRACWKEMAADKEHSVFVIGDELLEVNKIAEDIQLVKDSCLGNNLRMSALNMVVAGLNSGLSFNSLEMFRTHMFPDSPMPTIQFMSILGMAGIGKTILAKEIFEDQSISDHFNHRVWITLGPTYRSEEVLVDILARIYPDFDKVSLKEDESLAKELSAKLSNQRCLIVLDDVWKSEALEYLEELLKKSKAKVLVTTRLKSVARLRPIYRIIVRMRLLNKEESWNLLRLKVFGEEGRCPFSMEQPGKQISENCDGLPLLILMVADHLSKEDKTLEYWNQVANQKQNEVFMNAHSEISKSLVSSYESLPHYLKACFLYMGVFRENQEISISTVIKLWDAEGFLESENVEDFAEKCLNRLTDESLVMTCQSSYYTESYRLHSVFWHLSNSEAGKSKFFHTLDTRDDTSMEGIESERRLCIHNSTLLGIKDLHSSIASISATRSLLCTGPPHPYPVTIDFGLRLLKVLDALTICLYGFPIELVKLIHLRYLALTCSGKLPSSISNLSSLLYLIVGQHLSIKSSEDLLFLPDEIWDMKELKHVHITGRSLTDPQNGVVLPNLSTLLDVSGQSCTFEFFKGIPNLKRLGIQIELDPDVGIPSNLLENVSCLTRLESLECVVVNPEFGAEFMAPPIPTQMFPSGLRKLSLSGLGYPWEYMSIIGQLKKLEVLELRCYAFQGETWIADAYSFKEVQYLLLEDIDLVRWELGRFSFPNLDLLSMKHCYQLEELPRNFSRTVYKIEAVDCNMFVMGWAEEVKEVDLNNMHISRDFLEVEAHASWNAKKVY